MKSIDYLHQSACSGPKYMKTCCKRTGIALCCCKGAPYMCLCQMCCLHQLRSGSCETMGTLYMQTKMNICSSIRCVLSIFRKKMNELVLQFHFYFGCRSSASQLCLMCWLIVFFCCCSVFVAAKSKTWVIRYHYLADEVMKFKEVSAQRQRGLFGFTRKIAPL